jgi:hypothetical protein
MDMTNWQAEAQAGGDALLFLQLWYLAQCVDERHDSGGLAIEAVDGPGWWITIDLRGTALEGRILEATLVDRGEGSWHQSWSDGQVFTVATSILQLAEGISEFRRFALRSESGRGKDSFRG